jgi:hypothetical protein
MPIYNINHGQDKTYDKAYPVAGTNQSSQQFRDNFSVLESAILNLYTATASSSSIFTLTTGYGPSADDASKNAITYTLGLANNHLKLPSGDPTVALAAGMIRYNPLGYVEMRDGLGWQRVSLHTDTSGLVGQSGTGFLVRTGTDVFTRRTLAASTTANRLGIAVTNGDGVADNPGIGLNIAGLADTANTLAPTDSLPVYSAATNKRTTVAEIVAAGGGSTFVR